MDSLKILIKLAKKNLDEFLLQKKNLLIKKEEFLEKIKENKQKRLEEQQKYQNSEYAHFLESFIKNSEIIEKKLKTRLVQIEKNIEILDEQISESFAELKRFEIIETNKKLEALKKEKILETKMLDEISTIKANRQS